MDNIGKILMNRILLSRFDDSYRVTTVYKYFSHDIDRYWPFNTHS